MGWSGGDGTGMGTGIERAEDAPGTSYSELKIQWRMGMENFPPGFWIWEQPEITVFFPPSLPDWIFGPNPDDNSNKSDVNCITSSVNEMSEMPEVPRHHDRQPQDVVIAIGETCHLPQQT